MSKGRFITLEGVEGAGKSTAMRFIQLRLNESNIDTLITREPGGTPIAEEIRNVLLHTKADEKMFPQTELLLMFASREQHIKQCIEPALTSGRWVVSDRYVDASYAYQGAARGVNLAFIKALDEEIVGSLYPELTFLLDLPAELGLERAAQRNPTKDRIESEKIEFFEKVRQGYLDRAKEDPKRFVIIDASKNIDEVSLQMQLALDSFLKAHK